jgi:hypothetical protein
VGTVEQNREPHLLDDYASEAVTDEDDRSVFLQVGKLMHLYELLR